MECVSTSGIDIEMLKNQEEPILFYDEFILYQVHFLFVFVSNSDLLLYRELALSIYTKT